MASIIPDSVKAILLGLIAIVFVLNRLARWFPDVWWIQIFRLPELRLTEEQKERRRRHGNQLAGLEIILAGMILPLLHFVSTVMMFNEPTRVGLFIVGACSILCVGLGIWIFVRNTKL